jgi:small-conductance mechanosensitive channel
MPAVLAPVLAAGANDPGLVRACGPKGSQSWLCSTVFRISGDSTAADVADAIAKPLRIALIIVIAWLLVRLTRVVVARFVRQLATSVDKLASLRAGVAFVDTGPMPQARRVQRAETIGAVLRSAVAVVIWAVALLTVLDELGVNLAPLLAGAGIVGLAIGFGAQSLVRDFLSGLFMLLEDQYGVGDVVDVGLANGTIEGVSLRTTRLRDVDGVVWHVPNGEIQRVGNKSQQWARAVVDVAIAYDADVAAATRVIAEVGSALWQDPAYADLMLGSPEVLGVEALEPGRLVIRVTARTRPLEQWRVARELRVRIKAALDAAGIAAPSG